MTLTLIHGDGLTADEAAYALLADAARKALETPGLSPDGTREMHAVLASSLRASGLVDAHAQRGGDAG